MANISHNLYKLPLMFLLLACVHVGVAASGSESDGNAEAFKLMENARSGAFFYDSSIDFSKYDKVMLFPITYDQVKIKDDTGHDYLRSWKDFGEAEWKKVANYFDTFAHEKFSRSEVFKLEEKPGEGVVVLQVRMLEFVPHTGDPVGTVGQSFNLKGLGNMKLQAVLVDSKKKQLLAVVESINSINSGHYTGEDNSVSRNLAWRRSFKRIINNLHDDMEQLRRQKPVEK